MAGVVADKIFVVSIHAVRLEENVFNLASHVVSLLINIKFNPRLRCLSTEIAALTIRHLTVDIKINAIVPRQAESDCSGISNLTSSSSDTLFSQSTVFASGVGRCLSSVSPGNSSLGFEFGEESFHAVIFVSKILLLILSTCTESAPVLDHPVSVHIVAFKDLHLVEFVAVTSLES
jgi:hypothetical protein